MERLPFRKTYKVTITDKESNEIEVDEDLDFFINALREIKKFQTEKEQIIENRQINDLIGDKIILRLPTLLKMLDNMKFEEIRLFIYLLVIANNQNMIKDLSQEYIAMTLNTHNTNISKNFKKLEKRGFVEIIKKGRINNYKIKPNVVWKDSIENWRKYIKEHIDTFV